ncbi:hypothetical protein MRB53_012580 [Persea americana]|uniref:Uncharacterized protein n=1 Tax=Persea americana TaxID=3435 RepID=A0ACC2LYN6_PERAE|nr:hypothetical protein MRB53_012580 [Persea americana]
MEAPMAPPPLVNRTSNHRPSMEGSRGYSCVATDTRDLWDRLFDQGYQADVLINTINGGVIHAHSIILGMASPVLKNMLNQSKGRKRSIAIRGVPHQAVQAFIRFIYSSKYEQEEMNRFVLHLMVLSHVFMIPSLKLECMRKLEKGMLTTDNVVDIFQLAKLCDAPRLSLICQHLIINNFKVVSASEGWKIMRQSNPNLEKELIESLVEANSRKEERTKKLEERMVYQRLYEAMEAIVHICRDGCRTIGPHDKVLQGNGAPCNFPACKGLESLIRHFAGCKNRVSGGCTHCRRMWQILELHSRICAESNLCKVPLCSHFKEKMQQQYKKDEEKWKLLANKVAAAKNIAQTSTFPHLIAISA